MCAMRASTLVLGALLIGGCSTLGEPPSRGDPPDIDATVQALVAEVLPAETAVPTPDIDATVQALVVKALPTETAVPMPDIDATVQAMVVEALPTETALPTPDIEATVQAIVAEVLPTETAVATTTPSPTPTLTPAPTPPRVSTPAPTPTPTPVPTSTPTPTPDPLLDTTVNGQRFGGDLRIVSQGSVSTLDPVFSTYYVVYSVASHIYEGLYGWDGELEPQPRLAESFRTSADGTEYTFKLRSGIEFHNRDLFTSADAVASISRWRDANTIVSGTVRKFAGENALRAVDDTTFTWTFDEPLGAVILILGFPHGLIPMVPEEMAATPYTAQMPENVGTGAYRFAEWLRGDRVVLERNERYRPRTEPSSPGAYAGENIAYLETLTFLEVHDEETKIAGLETGEWDVVDGVAFEFFERLTRNPDVGIALYQPGNRSNVYLNPQIPPFSYQKVRQALMTGVDVEDFMFALAPSELWISCPALYWCGTSLETDVGARFDIELEDGSSAMIGYDVNNAALARRLLAESDYAGETAVILNPTDYGTITPLGPVLKSVMEEIGYEVEMPVMDWATVVSMFGHTDSYNLATDWHSHWCCGNPIQDHLISGTFDFIIRDEELSDLRLEFAREADGRKRFRIMEEIQRQRWKKVTSLTLGQFFPILPHTSDLKGFEVKAIPFYANTWLER